MEKLYNVGAYVRLSVDSASYDSESVENQREMLSKFIAMMPGWVEQKFYVDDGFSGATFERPAFQEMIADVRQGLINLVIVKDLSRFGRNYLEAGHYLEETLPSLGCRFVSVMENIDTENGENDIMPFYNAMNDYYVKNHSDRIRSIMAAKAKDGQKISGIAPYGYRRNPDDNTRLIIDEYAAGIVRRIFEMRKRGMGFYTINKTLNTEGIMPPTLYYQSIAGANGHKPVLHWRPCLISTMLKNELYIGNAIQLEKKKVSYRNKREVARPVEEQIRIDGAFPAIIDRETWDAVQVVNQQAGERSRKKRAPEKRLFTGILRCADCGASMVSIKNNYVGKRNGTVYISYLCGKFHASGGSECSRHSAGEKSLGSVVFERIRQLTEQVIINECAVAKSLSEQLIGERRQSQAQRKRECASLKLRIHKIEVLTAKLYEDRVAGLISEDSFSALIQKNEAERLETEKRLSALEMSEREATEKTGDIQKWIRLVKENAGKINDRDLLESLVEKIEIGEGKVINGVKEQEVRIFYRFIGEQK